MDATPVQVFIRDEKGKIWGPLGLPTITLLVDNGMVEGRVQVSLDGLNFAFPGRFPALRDAFPRDLWGDVVAPGPERAAGQAEPAPVQSFMLGDDMDPLSGPVPSGSGPGAQPLAPGATPMAGPGAMAATKHQQRPAAPAAGPGTRPQLAPQQRPTAPARPQVPPGATGPRPAAPPAPAPKPPPPPPVVDLSQPAPPPPSGSLSAHSSLHLYYLAASQDLSGLLTLRLADRSIELHFRKGNPEYVASSHPEDSLTGFIVKSGMANAEQVKQAEAALDRFGGELVGALFGLGILNPGTAFAQLMQRAIGLLVKAVGAEEGTFTFEPKELPPHRAMPLGNRWAVLSDLVRRVPIAELKRRLAPCVNLPIMKSLGRVPVTELRLTPQEARALTHIDGVRSLSQLWSDLPPEADALARLAFMLRELELVSFSSTAVPPRPAAAEPPRAAPPPAASGSHTPAAGNAAAPRPAAPAASVQTTAPRPAAPAPAAPAAATAPRPAAPATPPVSLEAELAELARQVARMKEQNLFQVLGLDEKADTATVKAAYFKLAKVYHPDTVPSSAPPELAKLKGEVFGAVSEAYRTLSDDRSRANYLDGLKSGSHGEDVDVQQLLMAEELFQKGSIMVKARKFADAVKMLDDAIKANPSEGEFYAWRGFAKYFTHQDKKLGMSEAMKDLQLCLKKNERCAPAYYFIGQLAKLSGDNSGAMRQFKKAVDLNPQHVEAQRELRMMNTRK